MAASPAPSHLPSPHLSTHTPTHDHCPPVLLLLVGAAAPGSAATKKGKTRVAFQGSAALFGYYSGVSWALQKGGVIVPGKTKLSGLSGGAHTSIFSSLGMSGPDQRDFWIDMLDEVIARTGNFVGYFHSMILDRVALDPRLIGAAKKVSNKVTIAISQLDSRKTDFNDSAVWLVDQYANDRELASAMTATSHLPCFSGLTTYTVFKGQPVVDGAFANGFEELW